MQQGGMIHERSGKSPGPEKPKEKPHHKPKNPVVQIQTGTNYVAQCSGCGEKISVKTISDKPEIECITCQKPFNIIMTLPDEQIREK